jgi:hypothetical protein
MLNRNRQLGDGEDGGASWTSSIANMLPALTQAYAATRIASAQAARVSQGMQPVSMVPVPGVQAVPPGYPLPNSALMPALLIAGGAVLLMVAMGGRRR